VVPIRVNPCLVAHDSVHEVVNVVGVFAGRTPRRASQSRTCSPRSSEPRRRPCRIIQGLARRATNVPPGGRTPVGASWRDRPVEARVLSLQRATHGTRNRSFGEATRSNNSSQWSIRAGSARADARALRDRDEHVRRPVEGCGVYQMPREHGAMMTRRADEIVAPPRSRDESRRRRELVALSRAARALSIVTRARARAT